MRVPRVPWAVEGGLLALLALNAADLLLTVYGLTSSPYIHEVAPVGAPLIAAGGLAAVILVKLAAMCALVGVTALYVLYCRPEGCRWPALAIGAAVWAACAFYIWVVANNVWTLYAWL